MRNLHYLKDTAINAYESGKGELKNYGKDGNRFLSLQLYTPPKSDCLTFPEISQTEIYNILAPTIQKLELLAKFSIVLIFISNIRLR